ncbi:MAG: sigma factor [Cellulosimicrobium cellulans]
MGNKGDSEEVLWRQSLLGQGDAFGALYDRHRDRVFRHAYRLCGNHHDAEDIMAASFLELWRRRRQVRVVEGSNLTPAAAKSRIHRARQRLRAALNNDASSNPPTAQTPVLEGERP